MKIWKILSLILITAIVSFQVQASTGDDANLTGGWKQIYDKKGILGFERSFPGTDIKEFKAVGFIEAKMEVIGEVLRDIPSFPMWMAKCKEAKILKEIDRNTKIFYNEVKTPWPIPNRGVIITNETKYDLETGRAVITFKAIKDDENFPVKKGRVQIVDLSGKYLMEFFGRDMTRVTYIHKADPAGNIPVSMANIESRLYPVINLKGLRKMVKMKKYQELGQKCEEHDLIESMLASDDTIEQITRRRVNEFVLEKEIINLVFEDKTIVQKIKKEKASFASIKNLIIDTCKTMLQDERIRAANRNKSLRDIMVVDKFFDDRVLARMISHDSRFVGLLLDDKDVMKKILTDRILLSRILDSKRLAKSITNNPELVSKMLYDKEFAESITKVLPDCKTIKDFRAVIKNYVDSNKG